MLAGPSEVLVIADSTADVETVAADLLAQVSTPELIFGLSYCRQPTAKRPCPLRTSVRLNMGFLFRV